MGMPFAQIVKPGVVVASFLEELVQLRLVLLRISHKPSRSSALPLNRYFDQTKNGAAQMLREEEASDFTRSSGLELFDKLVMNLKTY
jgi:hypothetical protein